MSMEALVLFVGLVNIVGFFVFFIAAYWLFNAKELSVLLRVTALGQIFFGAISASALSYFLLSFASESEFPCGPSIGLACQSELLFEKVTPYRWAMFLIGLLSFSIALLMTKKIQDKKSV